MKIPFILFVLALAGCRTAAVAPALPAPPSRPVEPPRPPAMPAVSPTLALEQKVRHQAQIIEALISQNDALAGRAASPVVAVPVPSPIVAIPAASPPPLAKVPVSDLPTPEPVIVPNADGVIDLVAAVVTPKAGEPVNPFAVRVANTEGTREVTIHVSGIIAGPIPCAVINERLIRSGEAVESLTVAKIDAGAVEFRRDGQRVRLPVAAKPVRVRMPL